MTKLESEQIEKLAEKEFPGVSGKYKRLDFIAGAEAMAKLRDESEASIASLFAQMETNLSVLEKAHNSKDPDDKLSKLGIAQMIIYGNTIAEYRKLKGEA